MHHDRSAATLTEALEREQQAAKQQGQTQEADGRSGPEPRRVGCGEHEQQQGHRSRVDTLNRERPEHEKEENRHERREDDGDGEVELETTAEQPVGRCVVERRDRPPARAHQDFRVR